MRCPSCGGEIFWLGNFLCNEVHFCECGEGVISFYECTKCNVKIQITKDCIGGDL
jgi:hypothetical protein